MEKDDRMEDFFSDNERYADLINGLGCGGKQTVKKEDLQELDRHTGIRHVSLKGKRKKKKSVKIRDLIRKTAFGVNFAVIGIENQEMIDYSMPLRNMVYEVGEYEQQAAKIRRDVRRNRHGLTTGEYLYGFTKESKLYPAVTLVLYYGEKDWDGATNLHEMLDFTDIPAEIRKMVQNYEIHIISIRDLKDTSMFRTDVKQVFDFIRFSNDPEKLRELVKTDKAFQEMEEDAYELAALYSNSEELMKKKDDYLREGKVDMCRALDLLIQEGEAKGKAGSILELLEEYGNVPQELQKRIEEEKNIDVLKKWTKLVIKVKSSEEFEKLM